MPPCSLLSELSLLLIDDDQWIRSALRLFFEIQGCCVVALSNAEEGLEICKYQSFDIVIAADHLPDLGGLEFMRRMNHYCPHTPKVLITAYGNHTTIENARRLGISHFIFKPLTPRELLTCINELVVQIRTVDH